MRIETNFSIAVAPIFGNMEGIFSALSYLPYRCFVHGYKAKLGRKMSEPTLGPSVSIAD